MANARLMTAFDDGLIVLPDGGFALAIGVPGEMDLSGFADADLRIVQRNKADFDRLVSRGFSAEPELPSDWPPFDIALVVMPRSRKLGELWIAEAAGSLSDGGTLIVDGAKTDGIDAIYRACRDRLNESDSLTKAHGRLFWGRPKPQAFADWRGNEGQQFLVDGFHTAPGVFSADHVDPGSQILADALPDDLSGAVVDLGAGWGFLAAQILRRERVSRVDLVEADHAAFTAAQCNIDDSRAAFHWADATRWTPDSPADVVVTNPPFHTGRRPDPSLGRGFIASAARILSARGTLWLVANRHLPYEGTFGELFHEVDEVGGSPAFKVVRARKPRR